LAVDPNPNVTVTARAGADLFSRSVPRDLLLFTAHPLFVARSAELSNDDAAERRQGLLTLLVR
jgi:hypothetical protein